MNPNTPPQDPMDFMKNMWSSMGFSLPGMATPTLDVGELDKRIQDLKAVEGWLKLNLSTLQMSIQGLEMQRATIAAMQAMGQTAAAQGEAKGGQPASPFGGPGMWPWNLMQPPEGGTPGATAGGGDSAPSAAAPESPPRAGKSKK